MTAETGNTEPKQISADRMRKITPVAAGPDFFKKTFVEPEVSFPLDVLEATTFFQFTESGPANP